MSTQISKEEKKVVKVSQSGKGGMEALATTMYVLVAREGRIAGHFYNAETGQTVPSMHLATLFPSERQALETKAPVGQRYKPYPVTVIPGSEAPGSARKIPRGVLREGTFFRALEVGDIFEDLTGNLCIKTFPVYSNHGVGGPAATFNAVILTPAEDAPPEAEIISASSDQEQQVTIRVPMRRGSPLYFRDSTFVDRAEVAGFQYDSTRKARAKA